MPNPATAAVTISAADIMARDGKEPRVRDLALAKTLGFAQPINVRKVIRGHKDELAMYGDLVEVDDAILSAPEKNKPRGKGRPGSEYWLNEEQALLVCMFARTPTAATARKTIIDVFVAWRRNLQTRPSMPAHRPAYASPGKIRAAKLRLAEAVVALDGYGVDIEAIDIRVVRDFGRAFLTGARG